MARFHRMISRLSLPLCLVLLTGAGAFGQGRVIIDRHPAPPGPPDVIRPRPVRTWGMDLKYQRVNAEIVDGVATTEVQQTFRNPFQSQVEGTYIFPLPGDAAVGDFRMSINGKEMRGEVLDADAARRTYEEIVRRTRDPGLLEYLGSRLYKASIFPIPPGGQLDVKLNYSQTIAETGGLGLFQHPLRGDRSSGSPVEQLLVHVKLRSTLPLTSVFCPSHKCDIQRPNDHEATVTYEQANARPDQDFLLYYQRQDSQFGLSLLTHRAAAEEGYFLLRLSPRVELTDEQLQAKDVAFVIDTSGSMSDGKLEQVKKALKFCLNSLSPRDRFNIYAFSTEVRPFRDALVPADAEVRQAAAAFTDELNPLGGTNINQALLAALRNDTHDAERPYLIAFMTDGEPTVDVTDPGQILQNVTQANSRHVRFHVLGVGTEVNTHLLDKLAETNRGSRDYCTQTEDLELKLSAFYQRIAYPVLTDIQLVIQGLKTYDLYPQTPPDLFRGNDLTILGRYDGRGQHAVRFSGKVGSTEQIVFYEGEFPQLDTRNSFLPRLWAVRKVGYLLDQIRLHGQKQELVDEVVHLAKRHGIVTPYTSALIVEEGELAGRMPMLRGAQGAVAGRDEALGRVARRAGGGRGGVLMPSGGAAVDRSREIMQLKSLGYAATESDGDGVADALAADGQPQQVIRHVADKTFVFDGERWVDTAWNGEKKTHKLVAFSDEYFELLKQSPELGRYFSLGDRVVVAVGDKVYESAPPPEEG